MELDHIVIAVSDLAVASREFETGYGLASTAGGHHPAWGTANRIVPLGDSYLELVVVADESEAARSVFGRWVASGASERERPLGWAVRTTELDAIARRLRLDIGEGSRATPDDGILFWRSAGIDQAAAEPALPFFIEWRPGTRLPGLAAVAHPAGQAAISRVVLDVDPGRLATWLGSHSLPIEVRTGTLGVVNVVIATATGEIVLGANRR